MEEKNLSDKCKILIISPGGHFLRNILPLFVNNQVDFIISGIVSRTKRHLENMPEVPIFRNLCEVDVSSFDCIYSSSPNCFHAEEVKYAIRNEKHILVEKPICTISNILESKLILSAKTVVQEGLMYQYHHQFQALKKFLEKDNDLGLLRKINVQFLIPHLNEDNIRYSSNLDGGAFNDMAVYPLTFCSEIMKSFDVIHANSERKGYGVDVEGGLILADASCEATIQYGFGFAYKNIAEIVFENGFMTIARPFSKPRGFSHPIKIYKNMEQVQSLKYACCDHFQMMFEAFHKRIKSKVNNDQIKSRIDQITRIAELL